MVLAYNALISLFCLCSILFVLFSFGNAICGEECGTLDSGITLTEDLYDDWEKDACGQQ